MVLGEKGKVRLDVFLHEFHQLHASVVVVFLDDGILAHSMC